MTSDNGNVRWDQPLEVVYDNGDVFTPDESHGNYASWIDGDGDRRRHFFESDGRSNVSDSFRIRNKPAAAVVPEATAEEWGPAIEVGGVRPAWLGDDDRFIPYDGYQWFDKPRCERNRDIGHLNWRFTKSIRLPAHHPQYTPKPPETPAEAPLGVLTGVERVERLEGLVRRLAAFYNEGSSRDAEIAAEAILWMRDANEIVRQMAPPVDPDLLKAREICAGIAESMSDDGLAAEYRRGDLDEQFEMRSAIAGLRSLASDHRSK